EWKAKFDEIYSKQHGSNVDDDLKAGFDDEEALTVLQQTHQGGQASADAMFNHAEDGGMFGLGTNEWAATSALENADGADIKAYFNAHPERRQQLLNEFSGDDRMELEVLLVGKVNT